MANMPKLIHYTIIMRPPIAQNDTKKCMKTFFKLQSRAARYRRIPMRAPNFLNYTSDKSIYADNENLI